MEAYVHQINLLDKVLYQKKGHYNIICRVWLFTFYAITLSLLHSLQL